MDTHQQTERWSRTASTRRETPGRCSDFEQRGQPSHTCRIAALYNVTAEVGNLAPLPKYFLADCPKDPGVAVTSDRSPERKNRATMP
jgi:hypothetical protein